MTLGETIRAQRLAAGLTQRELADGLGIHLTYLSKLENDTKHPGYGIIEDFADALCPAEAVSLHIAAGHLPPGFRERMRTNKDFAELIWLLWEETPPNGPPQTATET